MATEVSVHGVTKTNKEIIIMQRGDLFYIWTQISHAITKLSDACMNDHRVWCAVEH